MIKYLGSIGCFVRLNDDLDNFVNFLNIFSSSSYGTLLFSASINNNTGELLFNSTSASVKSYINGYSGSIIPNKMWSHLSLSFDDKLTTDNSNNFIIRFGDTASSNFNIQNLYIMESSLLDNDPEYLHYSFTGNGTAKLTVSDTASLSINVIDYFEDNFISASSKIIYQPMKNQKRYLSDISAVKEESLSAYVSASVLINDDLFIDGFNITNGDRILSLTDNEIYELTASSQLLPISSSVGDFVKILFGSQYSNNFYIKTDSGFENTPARQKISSFVNISDTNNL